MLERITTFLYFCKAGISHGEYLIATLSNHWSEGQIFCCTLLLGTGGSGKQLWVPVYLSPQSLAPKQVRAAWGSVLWPLFVPAFPTAMMQELTAQALSVWCGSPMTSCPQQGDQSWILSFVLQEWYKWEGSGQRIWPEVCWWFHCCHRALCPERARTFTHTTSQLPSWMYVRGEIHAIWNIILILTTNFTVLPFCLRKFFGGKCSLLLQSQISKSAFTKKFTCNQQLLC